MEYRLSKRKTNIQYINNKYSERSENDPMRSEWSSATFNNQIKLKLSPSGYFSLDRCLLSVEY